MQPVKLPLKDRSTELRVVPSLVKRIDPEYDHLGRRDKDRCTVHLVNGYRHECKNDRAKDCADQLAAELTLGGGQFAELVTDPRLPANSAIDADGYKDNPSAHYYSVDYYGHISPADKGQSVLQSLDGESFIVNHDPADAARLMSL